MTLGKESRRLQDANLHLCSLSQWSSRYDHSLGNCSTYPSESADRTRRLFLPPFCRAQMRKHVIGMPPWCCAVRTDVKRLRKNTLANPSAQSALGNTEHRAQHLWRQQGIVRVNRCLFEGMGVLA